MLPAGLRGVARQGGGGTVGNCCGAATVDVENPEMPMDVKNPSVDVENPEMHMDVKNPRHVDAENPCSQDAPRGADTTHSLSH